MDFLIPSFLAGVLTILAPCVLALLPVIIGGTAGESNKLRPLVISLSLGISVMIFSLLLKATTLLIDIPTSTWATISGGIITIFALTMLFPNTWNLVAFKLKLYKSENLLHKNTQKSGLGGAMLLGASLGPVFSTCSPTYLVILSTVLPQSFYIGFLNLLSYSTGLTLLLIIIGYGGQKVTAKLKGASNPNGWFKKSIGILLLLTGLAIFTGYDKVIESKILDAGYLGPISIEQALLPPQ